MKQILTDDAAIDFERYLRREEKSDNTVEKYMRDARAFIIFAGGAEITKMVVEYKNRLIKKNYAARSVNSMLASLNSLFSFLGWSDCKAKSIKLQRRTYCPEERNLPKANTQGLSGLRRKMEIKE